LDAIDRERGELLAPPRLSRSTLLSLSLSLSKRRGTVGTKSAKMHTLRRGVTGDSSAPSGATRQLQGGLDALTRLPKAMKALADAAKDYRSAQMHLATAGQKWSQSLRALGDAVFECGCAEQGDCLRVAAEQLHASEEKRYVLSTRLWDAFVAPLLGSGTGLGDDIATGSLDVVSREVAGVREKLSKASHQLDHREAQVTREWAKAQKTNKRRVKKIGKGKGGAGSATAHTALASEQKRLDADKDIYEKNMEEVKEKRVRLDVFMRAYRDLHVHNGVLVPLSEVWQFFKEFSDFESSGFETQQAENLLVASEEHLDVDLPALPFVQISAVALEKRLVRPDNLRRPLAAPKRSFIADDNIQAMANRASEQAGGVNAPQNTLRTEAMMEAMQASEVGSLVGKGHPSAPGRSLPPAPKGPAPKRPMVKRPTKKAPRKPKKKGPRVETRKEIQVRTEPVVVEQVHQYVFALIDYETQGFVVDNDPSVPECFVSATDEDLMGVFPDDTTPTHLVDLSFVESDSMRVLKDRGDSWYIVAMESTGQVGIVSSEATTEPAETAVEVTVMRAVEEEVEVQVQIESSSSSSEYESSEDEAPLESEIRGNADFVDPFAEHDVADGATIATGADSSPPVSVLDKMAAAQDNRTNLADAAHASFGNLHRSSSGTGTPSAAEQSQPLRVVLKEGFITKKGAKRYVFICR
jgi:hypothetical protein